MISDKDAAKYLLIAKLRGVKIGCNTCKYYDIDRYTHCSLHYDWNLLPPVVSHVKFADIICKDWT